MTNRLLSACALLLALVGVLAPATGQLPAPESKPVIAPRMPALSPDGKRIAFVYRGDIWTADATGGRATALTRNVEMNAFPQYSPDGKWILFASQRTGGWGIFVMPADGGAPKRLTWHSGGGISYGWSPDGKQIVFTTHRETGDAELLTMDVATLRLRKLAQDYKDMNFATFSPDGKKVVFGYHGQFHWSRPRYNGSGAAQIALLDVATGKRTQITDDDKQHLWTRFLPDGKSLITVTYADVTPSSHKLGENPGKFTDTPGRTPNLWHFDLAGHGRQITKFIGGSVRCPAVAAKSGDIAFEYGTDLWLMRAGQNEPQKVQFTAAEDEKLNQTRREVITSGVNEAEPSPDGKTFAFGVRGEIWTVPVEKPKGVAGKGLDIARRMTDWAGDDSDFLWAPDGKKFYYRSDRDYVNRVFEMDTATLQTKCIWNRADDADSLHMSPDGKSLAMWVSGGEPGLYTIALADGAIKRILPMPFKEREWQDGGDFAWSPDMKWLAVCIRETSGNWNVWVMPAGGQPGEAVNVTRLNAGHGMPRWTADGKYLLFESDRDGNGLYAIPLTKEQARLAEMDIKFEKPKDPVAVNIDFDGITQRIRKLCSQDPGGDMVCAPDGSTWFTSEGDIWQVSYDGKDVKRVTSGGGCSGFRMMKDGKRAFFVRNGELYLMKLDASNAQEKVTFTADYERDVRNERRAAFTQFWAAFNRRFYDPNMHGRDWEAVRKRYEPMLEGVEHRAEFATVLSMMVGELESSHSEVGTAPGGVAGSNSAHPGFTYDYTYEGPGIRVDKVPAGAPGSYEKTQIKPGEYVMAINGKDVTLDENLYKVLNDQAGRVMEFLVNSKPSKEGARKVSYTALGYGDWGQIRYENRINRLRKYVEEKSGGKISYVHIAGMGGNNQTTFDREMYEYSIGKKAMIIDVRFNGGGNISDTLMDWLERKTHGYYQGRGNDPEPAPGRAWEKPTVVLQNEHSFSNAEMFPAAMKARGLATLVGMPTPGYVIWTWELRLVDGTPARMPGSGVYRLDGTPMEDMGQQPDILVPMSGEDWLADRDPQLDKAIEVLMAKMK